MSDFLQKKVWSFSLEPIREEIKSHDESIYEIFGDRATRKGRSTPPNAGATQLRVTDVTPEKKLADALEHGFSPRERCEAAADLGKLFPTTQRHAIILAKASVNLDEDEEIRKATAAALDKLGAAAELHAKALANALATDVDHDVRKAAAIALGKLGIAAEPHVSVLVGALTKDGAQLAEGAIKVRRAAADALGNLGGAAAPLGFRVLAKALRGDEDNVVRKRAAIALGKLGGAAAAVSDAPNGQQVFLSYAHALAHAVEKDEVKDVRSVATLALNKAFAAAAAPHAHVLVNALESSESRTVRRMAAEALGELRFDDDDSTAANAVVVDALTHAAENNEDNQVRWAAEDALKVGGGCKVEIVS